MAKKLLYIINHMDWFWSHRLPLAAGARKAGWQVSVACEGAGGDEKLAAHGFEGVELPPAQNALSLLKAIFAIRQILQEHKPDLVHAITLKYAFMLGLAARMSGKTRLVYTIAGLGYLFSGEGWKPRLLRLAVGPLLKLALRHKNAVLIFQNPDDQKLLIDRGFAREEQTVLIRGSGVDMEDFPFVPEPEDEMPLVVMPTRLVHDKGVAVFVEAARLLKDKGVKARFVVAGGLSAHNPLAITEAEMKTMVADGAAEWAGKVDNMPALYAASTLIVYPSYYKEGVPKVLLEAAATGRAIVTTDHPGCREAVKNGENGLLVPVKDAQATAEAVRKLLEDKTLRQQMGKASRTLAEEEFEVKLVVKKTLNVYRLPS